MFSWTVAMTFALDSQNNENSEIHSAVIAYLYVHVIDAKHFSNDLHSDKNAIMSSVLIP